MVEREQGRVRHLFRQRCYSLLFRGHGIGRQRVRRVSLERFYVSVSPFPMKAPVEHQFPLRLSRGRQAVSAVRGSVLRRHSDSCVSISPSSLGSPGGTTSRATYVRSHRPVAHNRGPGRFGPAPPKSRFILWRNAGLSRSWGILADARHVPATPAGSIVSGHCETSARPPLRLSTWAPRFRSLARLYRVGLATHRIPTEGFW